GIYEGTSGRPARPLLAPAEVHTIERLSVHADGADVDPLPRHPHPEVVRRRDGAREVGMRPALVEVRPAATADHLEHPGIRNVLARGQGPLVEVLVSGE